MASRLREAAHAAGPEPQSLQRIADLYGAGGCYTLLVLLGVVCLIPLPGVGTVLGVGVSALALALWRGNAETALPVRAGQVELSRESARRLFEVIAKFHDLADRFICPRLSYCVELLGARGMASVARLMGILIALPIPLGNALPAVALICIGLAQPGRDGLVLSIGLGIATLGLVWPVTLAVVAWRIGFESFCLGCRVELR